MYFPRRMHSLPKYRFWAAKTLVRDTGIEPGQLQMSTMTTTAAWSIRWPPTRVKWRWT